MNLQIDEIWQRGSGGQCYVGWISQRGESLCTTWRRMRSDRWFKRKGLGPPPSPIHIGALFPSTEKSRRCSGDWFFILGVSVRVQIRWFERGRQLLTGHLFKGKKNSIETTPDFCWKFWRWPESLLCSPIFFCSKSEIFLLAALNSERVAIN